MNILLGLLIIGFGIVLLLNYRRFYFMFGRSRFLEQSFPGGTSGFLQVFPLLVIMFGIFTMTGVLNGLISSLTQPFNALRGDF